MVDNASRAVRVNREFVRMFGYLQGEIIGKTLVSFIFPEELRREAGRFADLMTHGQIVSLETLRTRKDGQRIDVSLLPVRLQAFPLV